jgi:hypothetical protein
VISDTNVHAWTPIILALEHPEYFYPVFLVVFLIAAGIWWWWPYYQATRYFPTAAEKRQAAESALRKDLTLFYTGSVVVFGIIGAVIQFQANLERDHRQQRASLSAENAKRFDGAVTQLQSGLPLSTLGGIFALSELMTQEGFYWQTVAEIQEYVRRAIQNAKGNINTAEIHNALRTLSERDAGFWVNRFSEPFPLDFSGIDLSNLKFSRLKLWGSDFQNTNLSGAELPGAMMEGTEFHCADFENAHLEMSYLHESTDPTELGPNLTRTNFRNAYLFNVRFKPDHNDDRKGTYVDTSDSCFQGANLDGADISHFDLTNAPGLTREQINKTQFHPVIPEGFQPILCNSFKSLCPTTPSATAH